MSDEIKWEKEDEQEEPLWECKKHGPMGLDAVMANVSVEPIQAVCMACYFEHVANTVGILEKYDGESEA